MGDLKVYEIPLENITLEKFNVRNKQHMEMIERFRDPLAREMCYDVRLDVALTLSGKVGKNNFLVKNDNEYFGYIQISDDISGERTLCYIVQEKLRGKGLGKIMLNSVSDYLLENNLASTLKLCISKSNYVSAKLAMQCGFEKGNYVGGNMVGYYRKK